MSTEQLCLLGNANNLGVSPLKLMSMDWWLFPFTKNLTDIVLYTRLCCGLKPVGWVETEVATKELDKLLLLFACKFWNEMCEQWLKMNVLQWDIWGSYGGIMHIVFWDLTV